MFLVFLLYSVLLIIQMTFNFMFFNNILLTAFSMLAFYWLLSIFIYLYNNSRYSNFTTSINSFWRSSFMLFWIIEGFLFSIYIFMLLSCSIETEWLAEQGQLFKNLDFLQNSYIMELFYTYVAMVSLALIMRNFIYNNLLVLKVLVFAVFVGIGFFFWSEFFQFFYYMQIFSFNTAVWDAGNTWEMSYARWPALTNFSYLSLMIFLNFWHAMFILYLLGVNLRIVAVNNYFNSSQLRISMQNMYFYFVFNLFIFLYVFKYYMNYDYSYVYYWFFVNNLEPNSWVLSLINIPANLISLII